MNRLEELLDKLINGNPTEDWKCLNRLEQYLICILTRSGIEELGEPMNRLEVLLRALYEVVPDSPSPLEVLSMRLEELDPGKRNASLVEVLDMHLEEIDPDKHSNTFEILSARLEAEK